MRLSVGMGGMDATMMGWESLELTAMALKGEVARKSSHSALKEMKPFGFISSVLSKIND